MLVSNLKPAPTAGSENNGAIMLRTQDQQEEPRNTSADLMGKYTYV